MTIACPSCQAQLRLSEKIQASGAVSARCPKCQQAVPLTGAASASGATPRPSFGGAGDSSIIRVSCTGCGAQLKAPADRAGSRSKCPRCSTVVTLGAPAAAMQAAPRQDHEESSGAATRRIDSRLLGSNDSQPGIGLSGSTAGMLAGSMASGAPSRSAEPRSPAVDLMSPPADALRSAAHDIREAARSMDPTLASAKPQATPAPPARRAEPKPAPLRDTGKHKSAHDAEPAQATGTQDDRPYPVWRGVLAGTIAGGLVGGALWAIATGKISVPDGPWKISPLPVSLVYSGVPDSALGFALVVILTMMVGLTASGAGAPTVRDKPLGFLRCTAIATLTGLALGAATMAFSGSSATSWPPWAVINWGRDMLAAGILTSLIGAIISPRS